MSTLGCPSPRPQGIPAPNPSLAATAGDSHRERTLIDCAADWKSQNNLCQMCSQKRRARLCGTQCAPSARPRGAQPGCNSVASTTASDGDWFVRFFTLVPFLSESEIIKSCGLHLNSPSTPSTSPRPSRALPTEKFKAKQDVGVAAWFPFELKRNKLITEFNIVISLALYYQKQQRWIQENKFLQPRVVFALD